MIDRIPLNAPEFRQIAASLNKCDPKSVIPQAGALLTVPELQANTIRLETLAHLAVAYCQGKKSVPVSEIGEWLNRHLGTTEIAGLEDPPEDVFIGNVGTSQGNRRIFNGFWHSNDFFVQVVVDILQDPEAAPGFRDILLPALALLALSERVAERLGLRRWHSEESTPNRSIKMPSTSRTDELTRAVTFTTDDLRALGIGRELLDPFILHNDERRKTASQKMANSTIGRCPVLDLDGDLVLALPHAVGPAILRFALRGLREAGDLRAFSNALASRQARDVEDFLSRELHRKVKPLKLPSANRRFPSLDAWLLNYDVGKYIHVVLLHDRLDMIEAQGLSSFIEIPERQREGLEKHLRQMSDHCGEQEDFSEGMTLLIVAGLGRNYAMGFKELSRNWLFSDIQISDLNMLAGETDGSAARYLKLIKHKAWAQRQGVDFFSIEGDFNVYCYWRQHDYKLVPCELPLKPGSTVLVESNCARPVRRNVRHLTDNHLVKIVHGSYVPVTRLDRSSYFKSLMHRPIYVSLSHLEASVLAGVVETDQAPSWLVIKPRSGPEYVQRFLYEVWHQFIDLFCRLVFEIEDNCTGTAGVMEIRLNLDDVVVPEDYSSSRPLHQSGRPRVLLNVGEQTAEVKFPAEFLGFFRQPENTGERMVLRSIGQAVIGLRKENLENIDGPFLETILDRILGDSGIRVLHAFLVDPLRHLLATGNIDPNFSYLEDFTFAKLGLSAGCTTATSGKVISSKTECNAFLCRVVEKILNRLRSRLQRFDRASVIRSGLEACEAASQDREHWKRTAQALFALYRSTDDVHGVARQRELDRTNVSIAARTVIEMAICECPASGGRQLSKWDLDELLAEATLLIEVAMHSDAVYFDLTKPRIELQPNGEYVIDRSFRQNVVDPFVNAYYHGNFERVARDYPNLYNEVTPDRRVRDEEVFEFGFENAFHAEFGLMPQDVREAFSVLAELAIQCDSVVVETTLGDIKAKLTTDRGLTSDVCDRFINTFSIFHRPQWETPPEGFRKNDLFPWRYNRRLSASVKPILVFGEKDEDKVIYGAGTLANGCFHLLDRSENGRLPQEFYASKKMKVYIGKVNDARGHAFARSVADQMRERKWKAKTEVKMTELGAPVDLGDMDVLAWKSDGTIQLIECKRLTFARTIAEIANICKRFQGEAKDELAKHLRRVEWIRRNPQCLRNIVGFVPDPSHIDHRLVTNTQVPMKYMESLPIDPDKIGPLEQS